MLRNTRFLTFLVLVFLINVQIFPHTKVDTLSELETKELELQTIYKEFSMPMPDYEKIIINENFEHKFEQVLNLKSSFKYSFDSLKHVGKVFSPDSLFRIYTWNIPLRNGRHVYHGFLQYYDVEKNVFRLHKLTDKREKIEEPTTETLNPETWYGGLIYSILHNRHNNKDIYTLIAMELYDILSNKKFIDVLYFDDEASPVFGKPIFQTKDGYKSRLIYEYSSQAVMSMNYDERYEMIIFDHLSPIQPQFRGNYKFYGPDFSFDAYKFENGYWRLYEDVDVVNR